MTFGSCWVQSGKLKWCSQSLETVGGPHVICSTWLADDTCFLSLQTPRVCDDYWSEFRHCKSLWNRFHHYYTYGTSPSCQQWKEDYHNCREWEKHRTTEAKVQFWKLILFEDLNLWSFWNSPGCLNVLKNTCKHLKKKCIEYEINLYFYVLQEALQMSERNRVAEERKFTPVWKLRQDPPRDWHMPLNQEKPQDSWSVPLN